MGFIDGTGKTVIAPQFDDASGFSERLSAVKIAGKESFIDERGEVVISPRFDHAWPFSYGLAVVEVGHKRGYIDKSGEMVIDPQFTWAFPLFFEGLDYVDLGGTKSYMDRTGKVVFQMDEELRRLNPDTRPHAPGGATQLGAGQESLSEQVAAGVYGSSDLWMGPRALPWFPPEDNAQPGGVLGSSRIGVRNR